MTDPTPDPPRAESGATRRERSRAGGTTTTPPAPLTGADPAQGNAGASTEPQNGARRSAGTRRRGPGLLTWVGVLLICLGLGGFGWVGYQYVGTNAPAQQAASGEASGLRDEWSRQAPSSASPQPTGVATGVTTGVPADQRATAVPDSAMAILRIPRFGASYEKPVMVGTSDYALARGVSWYETTARPGQIGNFALAGHRVTHGEPFARLLELQVGDEVVIETRDRIYTYVIDAAPAQLTVKDVDTWVLDPVPGKTDVRPTQALITLTTCQDLFHSPDRSVGFGHLASTTTK